LAFMTSTIGRYPFIASPRAFPMGFKGVGGVERRQLELKGVEGGD
jgi:hypothetical protein